MYDLDHRNYAPEIIACPHCGHVERRRPAWVAVQPAPWRSERHEADPESFRWAVVKECQVCFGPYWHHADRGTLRRACEALGLDITRYVEAPGVETSRATLIFTCEDCGAEMNDDAACAVAIDICPVKSRNVDSFAVWKRCPECGAERWYDDDHTTVLNLLRRNPAIVLTEIAKALLAEKTAAKPACEIDWTANTVQG